MKVEGHVAQPEAPRRIDPPLREVDAERRAECAIDEIKSARAQWERQHRRPRALSAREALMVLEFESTLVAVAAGNVATGEVLSQADLDRLILAKRRISAIIDEAIG